MGAGAASFVDTMRKVALLLIVLLGVAHFAAVSRCEEGECGDLYNRVERAVLL